MISDTPRDDIGERNIKFSHVHRVKWLRVEDDFAFCKFVVDKSGNVSADYILGKEHRNVKVETFQDFLSLVTKVHHTFISNTEAELDACINLHPSAELKLTLLTKGSAKDEELGTWLLRTGKHKLNIRQGNKYWIVLDVSDLPQTGSYSRRTLRDAEEIKSFVIGFLDMCLRFNLVVQNNLTWANLGRNFLMTHVPRYAWPQWNPTETTFQLEFYRWCKGPHHGARVLGTFVGTDFDRIRSHLSIYRYLQSHSMYHCKYIYDSKRYNPDAAYALYIIHATVPKWQFMPWRINLQDAFTHLQPEVYGEQRVVVLQPELTVAIKTGGLKEGKDFKVLSSLQVVPVEERYPYRKACELMEELLASSPRDIHIKSMYHRFVGMMYHFIHNDDKVVTSSVFDPMVSATIWATERAQCWEVLMNSKNPQYARIDGGTAEEPRADDKYSLGQKGERFGFSASFKDSLDSTILKDKVYKYRDRSFIPETILGRLSFREANNHHIPLSEVGKEKSRVIPLYPGDECRNHVKIERLGQLLEDTIITSPVSAEEAMQKFEERRKEALKARQQLKF